MLAADPTGAAGLGLGGPTPHLFHAAAPDAYLETIGGELVVTRWQGVPLVRYNLHDACELLRWSDFKAAMLDRPSTHPARAVLAAAPDGLPDLIAIRGRADRCLILCGTNVSEAMLDEAVASINTPALITGVYRAGMVYENQRQRLALELECQSTPTAEQDAEVYRRFVTGLSGVQPEFQDDWQNVYRRWDDDPERRVVRITYARWPALSQRPEGQIKNIGIVL